MYWLYSSRQMQNIRLRSLGLHRKQNFEVVLMFKSDTAVLTFTFHFLSSPLFSLFLPHFLTRGCARADHELLQGQGYVNESLAHS